MKLHYWKSLLFVTITAAATAAQAQEKAAAGVYTPDVLQELTVGARESAPVMIEQDIYIATKDASRWRGYATYLPEVKAAYNIGGFHEIRDSVKSEDATRFGARAMVSANHPLYHWGAWEARRKLGIKEEEIAKAEAVMAYTKLCREVRELFYSTVIAKAALDAQSAEVAISQQELERMQLEFDQQRITNDALRSKELSHLSLELSQQRMELELDDRISQLRVQTGQIELTAQDIPTSVPMPPVAIAPMEADLATFLQGGYKETINSHTASLMNAGIDQQLVINKAKGMPVFNIGASVSQQPYENSRGSYELQTIFFGGISGQWTIFDRDETRDEKRQLLAQRRLVQAEELIVRDQKFNEARKQLRILTLQLRHEQMLSSSLDLAQRQLSLTQQEVQRGTADSIAADRKEAAVLQAQLDLLKTKAQIAAAYETFYNLIGQDERVREYAAQLSTVTASQL